MSKKLYALLLPVIAVAAMAMTAAAAQALPTWSVCKMKAGGSWATSGCSLGPAGTTWEWEKIPNGIANKVRVHTAGELKLEASNGLILTCQVADGGFIWNEAAGGKDEITFFENYECKSNSATCVKAELKPKGLPWKSKLIAGPQDEIELIKVTVFCEGGEVATFEGNLHPAIENSSAVFSAPGSGKLTGPGTLTATVSGVDGMAIAGTFASVKAE